MFCVLNWYVPCKKNLIIYIMKDHSWFPVVRWVLRPFLQLYIVGNLSLNMVAKTSLDCARNTLLCLWGLFIYIYQHVRNLSGWQNRCVYRTYPHLFSIWLMQFEWLSVCSRECEQAWICKFFIWNTVKNLLIYSVCETERVFESESCLTVRLVCG